MDGWKAETYRIIEEKKNKDNKVIRTIDKGWTCDLIPKPLVINRYFYEQQQAIDDLYNEIEALQIQLTELEEEYSGEGENAFFSELEKVNKVMVNAELLIIKGQLKTALLHKLKLIELPPTPKQLHYGNCYGCAKIGETI